MTSTPLKSAVPLAVAILAIAMGSGHAVAASPKAAPASAESVARETLMDTLAPALALRGATAVVTVAPDARRAAAPCDQLIGFVPPGARLVGRTLIGVRCADGSAWQAFVSAEVRVDAPAWQSTRALRAGETIGDADVATASMTMTAADLDVAMNAARANGRTGNAALRNLASLDGRATSPVGRVVMRPVAMGRALTPADVRDEGRINAGEAVRVIYQGDGFSVASDGHAVGPADPGASVQIRLASGSVVNGTLRSDHLVELVR